MEKISDLRLFRGQMHEKFMLPPKEWRVWLEEEIKFVQDYDIKGDDLVPVMEIFEQAIDQVYSDDILELYAQFLHSHSVPRSLNETFRSKFEWIINRGGSSFKNASKLWMLYRNFEVAVYPPEVPEEAQAASKRVAKLFKRQLSIPMAQLNETYEEWLQSRSVSANSGTENENEISQIENSYAKTCKEIEKIQPFEEDLLSKYQDYINYEVKRKNLNRTQSLFERLLGIFKEIGDDKKAEYYNLWLQYVSYCDRMIVLPNILLSIYERAVKNCPDAADVWQRYMLALERTAPTKAEQYSVEMRTKLCGLVNNAIANVVHAFGKYNIWTTYLNYLRRRIVSLEKCGDEAEVTLVRDVFTASLDSFMSTDDENYYLMFIFSLWANIEAKFFGSVAQGRAVWERCYEVTQLYSNEFFWKEWLEFETRFGNDTDCFQLLKRAISHVLDPQNLAHHYVRLVSTFSDDLTAIQAAQKVYDDVLQMYYAQQQEMEALKEKQSAGKKRKLGDQQSSGAAAKKGKKTEGGEDEANKHQMSKGYVQTDERKRSVTLFLSNLSYDVEESEIQSAFEAFGQIEEVRIVRNVNGRSKGFAYIVFDDRNAIPKALAADRMMLAGRPVFINEIDKRHEFEYSTRREKNKLFLKNLPYEYGEKEIIDKVLPEFRDSIKSVRISTNRNGISKGIAYVDMTDDKVAAEAVKAKNDQVFEGRTLFVAISDPSQSKAQPKPLAAKKAEHQKG